MEQIRLIAGERYTLYKIIESQQSLYFIGGYKIAITIMGVGYGIMETPYEVNSRGLERNQRIPDILTTQEALRDQYIEREVRALSPLGTEWAGGDYDLDGDREFGIEGMSPPQVYEGEGTGLNAWAIRAGHFRTASDAGSVWLSLGLFVREVDVPHLKELPNGFETMDVIGVEPGFLSRIWQNMMD